jgi:membrane protein implicated in regulation of membrane protease activity
VVVGTIFDVLFAVAGWIGRRRARGPRRGDAIHVVLDMAPQKYGTVSHAAADWTAVNVGDDGLRVGDTGYVTDVVGGTLLVASTRLRGRRRRLAIGRAPENFGVAP